MEFVLNILLICFGTQMLKDTSQCIGYVRETDKLKE